MRFKKRFHLDIRQDSRIMSLCSRHSLKGTLEHSIDQLNRCQRALNQFLEVLAKYSLSQAISN